MRRRGGYTPPEQATLPFEAPAPKPPVKPITVTKKEMDLLRVVSGLGTLSTPSMISNQLGGWEKHARSLQQKGLLEFNEKRTRWCFTALANTPGLPLIVVEEQTSELVDHGSRLEGL